MKQPAEIMVIPTAKKRPMPLTAVCRRVYKAAGYDEMTKARESFGELEFGDIVVTSGFNLNAHNVIHACVPPAIINIDEIGYQKAIRKSILKALRWAEERDVKSISFALFGTGGCRELAQRAASAAIRTHLRTEESCMKVYLVVPPSAEPVYEEQTEQSEQAERKSPMIVNYIDCYSEYGIRFEEKFRESKMPRDEFCRKYIYDLINLYIETEEQLEEIINYSKSSINRFKNGNIAKPDKNHVIAMAIALGLSDEERYNFINCARCKYPVDERDRIIETMMRSGTRDFKSVNDELIRINPDFALNVAGKSKNSNKKPKDRSREK